MKKKHHNSDRETLVNIKTGELNRRTICLIIKQQSFDSEKEIQEKNVYKRI